MSFIWGITLDCNPNYQNYSLTEHRFRRRLQDTDDTIWVQTKKQTQNPTLKWTFFLFRGVRELKFQSGNSIHVHVTNMTPELWKVVRLLGREYEKYYL